MTVLSMLSQLKKAIKERNKASEFKSLINFVDPEVQQAEEDARFFLDIDYLSEKSGIIFHDEFILGLKPTDLKNLYQQYLEQEALTSYIIAVDHYYKQLLKHYHHYPFVTKKYMLKHSISNVRATYSMQYRFAFLTNFFYIQAKHIKLNENKDGVIYE